MCKSLLGCVRVDPRKSQNNGMNHLYTRLPPVRRFPNFQHVRTGEREADAGEEPTQGVSEYLACITLRTLVNTFYANS